MKSDYSYDVQANANLVLKGGLRLDLNTLENARKSLARVIRRYARLELPREHTKVLIHGLNSLIAAFRVEYDVVDVQREIDEIKSMLKLKGREHGES